MASNEVALVSKIKVAHNLLKRIFYFNIFEIQPKQFSWLP